MPAAGFHERDGGMLGEDTAAERFLSAHVAFSAVVVLWIFALSEAFLGKRLRGFLVRRYELFEKGQSLDMQKHTAATLLMHGIFVPLSAVGLCLVPLWAFEVGAAPVVARAVAWVDASFLLLWELRELFFIDIPANKALVAHHLSTCVVVVAILDFDLLRDISWIQLLFLAANTAWLQRPVTILAKFVDDERLLRRAKTLGLAGVALDVVQLLCAGWFFVACVSMQNFGAAAVVLGAALPISYLRLQVNRWVCRFDAAFALARQRRRLDELFVGVVVGKADEAKSSSLLKNDDGGGDLENGVGAGAAAAAAAEKKSAATPVTPNSDDDDDANNDALVRFEEADALRARWLDYARRSSKTSRVAASPREQQQQRQPQDHEEPA